MNEKKYSYLPNSYTLKFFKELEEKQQKSFKPLIIINNIKTKKDNIHNNIQKKVKKQENNYKNIKKFTEKSLSSKKRFKLIEKRKKAIDIYLSTKKNTILVEESKKYISNNNKCENSSLSSLSKNIPYNPKRKNHSFQNSKKNQI